MLKINIVKYYAEYDDNEDVDTILVHMEIHKDESFNFLDHYIDKLDYLENKFNSLYLIK